MTKKLTKGGFIKLNGIELPAETIVKLLGLKSKRVLDAKTCLLRNKNIKKSLCNANLVLTDYGVKK